MLHRDQSPPAFSMGKGSRDQIIRKDRDLKNVGPGSYNRTFADKMKEPVYSMGAKLESSLVNKYCTSPDPTRYNPSVTYSKMKAPAFKIGTEERSASFDARKAKLVPAPGTYEIKSAAFNIEKPRFHMGTKLSFDDTTKFIHSIPGPGTHDPVKGVGKNKSPVYSMGAKLGSSLVKGGLNVPGPGTYVNSAEKLKMTAPSFGFGTSKRPELGATKLQVPGPGAYKVPTKLGDVPDFAMPNRKAETKYV